MEQVDVLEKKYETQRLATLEWGKDVDKLMRWIDDHLKRIMALEQPRQDKLDRLIEQDRKADDESQTLHTIALRMVDTLERLGVIPEIRDTLRRAIREPMEQPTPEVAPLAALSDALIRAECALSDIAEGDPECGGADPAQWAEQRCAETLAIIRPVMQQHKIRTSEWPPQPLPQAGEVEA
jgi:hypothetical protein